MRSGCVEKVFRIWGKCFVLWSEGGNVIAVPGTSDVEVKIRLCARMCVVVLEVVGPAGDKTVVKYIQVVSGVTSTIEHNVHPS